LYGEPESGKSFVALSMAMSIAAGHNWCDKSTKPASVLYIAAEDVVGFKQRAPAYQLTHSIVPERIQFLGTAINLLSRGEIEELLESIKASGFMPDLIIIDTLARCLPGADENSAQAMGAAIANIDASRRPWSATVLVIHHRGKNGKLERGSSALRGAADVMIECSRTGAKGPVLLTCEKMKDAERFSAGHIALQVVPLGDGRSSLAVADWKDVKAADPKKAWEALKMLENEFGSEGATHKEWSERFIAVTQQSLSTFNRTIAYFKKERLVRHEGDKYFPLRPKVGVRCQEVSGQCHDTSHEGHEGVTSPPS
jgi:hypothetical protein